MKNILIVLLISVILIDNIALHYTNENFETVSGLALESIGLADGMARNYDSLKAQDIRKYDSLLATKSIK